MINWIKNYIDKKVDQKVQAVLKKDKDFEKHAKQATRNVMNELVEIIIKGESERAECIWSRSNKQDRAAAKLVNGFRSLVRTALREELSSLDKRHERVHNYEQHMKEKVNEYVNSDKFIKRFVATINEYQVNGK